LWGDTGGEIYNTMGTVVVTYSDIQEGYAGTGNINQAPLFVDAAGGDFHLQSEAGHWVSGGSWVLDAQTSLCIDAGDPLSACGNEPSPNGGRINMGAYSNTAQASKSPPATLTVTTNSDTGDDATFGVSLGADEADGSGLSIREALNWASAGDNVTFDGGMSSDTITLSGTKLTINKDITLDGDLDDDSIPDITVSGNNTSQVIYTTGLTAAARLEGFTITNGYSLTSEGGGMYNHSSSPTISNCVFSNSASDLGGGMCNELSSPTISNCTFSNNAAQPINPMIMDKAGGGMFNFNSSSPTIIDCTFSGNTAVDWGGAILNHTSSPVITNCVFTGNSASNAAGVGTGGGIDNTNNSSPIISYCNFSGNSADGAGSIYNGASSPTITSCNFSINTADYGGGIWNVSSSPTITSCNFTDNTASKLGGGIYNTSSSSPTITNCTFSGNTASINGGGMYNNESTPTLTGCNFTANTADGGAITDALGGGMYNYKSTFTITGCTFLDNTATATGVWVSLGGGMSNVDSSLNITNCTFSGNTAEAGGGMYNAPSSSNITNCTLSGNSATYGGGIYNIGASTPNITNCILWGNTGGEVYNDTSPPVPSPVVTYCDVQGGYGGTGNIDTDPIFVNASGGDFHLLSTSPCIDAGNNAAPVLPATDIDGDNRIIDGDGDGSAVVDMGVDETIYPAIGSFTPTSAATGASVNITGTSFTGATAVKFGGTDAASFIVNLDTEITAVVGSGSSGNVTVITPSGTATKSGFTYIPPPPTITSVNPASAYAGSTASVAITGTNLTGATTVNFGSGITTTGFTADNSTQISANITISSGATPGTRDVSVTTPGGTANLSDGFSVLQVAIYGAPVIYEVQMNLPGTSKQLITNYYGKVAQTLEVTSADGLLTVTIPRGTIARQENGNRLTTFGVTINENPPPPPEGKNIIGLTYNFKPEGATFDPPITLTFTYNPEDIPEGVAEEDLVLAFYDEGTGEWIECECTCDPENNCVTACVCHFTDFAVIAPVPPPPEPAPVAFSLSKLTIQPAEVEPRQTVTITVSVANAGGTQGSYTVALEVNGSEEQRQSISIAAGGTKQVDFTVSREEPGDYVAKVGALEGSFTVTPPPTPVEKAPQQPELPVEQPVPTEEGGVNWYIAGTLLGVAVLLAIFIPVWVRRRREG